MIPGVTHANLSVNNNSNLNITNASLGLKFGAIGKLGMTGNVL